MSSLGLSLVQGYESEETETEIVKPGHLAFGDTDEEDEEDDVEEEGEDEDEEQGNRGGEKEFQESSSNLDAAQDESSLLPSAADVFASISGPPEFLKTPELPPTVETVPRSKLSVKSSSHDKKRYASGVVIQSKAHLKDFGPVRVSESNSNETELTMDNSPHLVRALNSEAKRGGTVKEKEKIKRIRGQSTHSSWKSETEMQLRQTYD